MSRFRSSHHCTAHSFANFGIKGTLAIYDSSAVLDLKFRHKPAAIMIGTSNPPHQAVYSSICAFDVRYAPGGGAKTDTADGPLRANTGNDKAYSITSSARPSSIGGTSRPIAFAALRLITSSNLVGCSTANSPGLAPLRILSDEPLHQTDVAERGSRRAAGRCSGCLEWHLLGAANRCAVAGPSMYLPKQEAVDRPHADA